MCFICDRISMIKDGTNPYFVKEIELSELGVFVIWVFTFVYLRDTI